MSAPQWSMGRRERRLLAAALTGLALVPGYFAVTLPWEPKTAFDIIGFLHLVQNLPRLFALALTVGLGLGAIGLWVQVLREGASDD